MNSGKRQAAAAENGYRFVEGGTCCGAAWPTPLCAVSRFTGSTAAGDRPTTALPPPSRGRFRRPSAPAPLLLERRRPLRSKACAVMSRLGISETRNDAMPAPAPRSSGVPMASRVSSVLSMSPHVMRSEAEAPGVGEGVATQRYPRPSPPSSSMGRETTPRPSKTPARRACPSLEQPPLSRRRHRRRVPPAPEPRCAQGGLLGRLPRGGYTVGAGLAAAAAAQTVPRGAVGVHRRHPDAAAAAGSVVVANGAAHAPQGRRRGPAPRRAPPHATPSPVLTTEQLYDTAGWCAALVVQPQTSPIHVPEDADRNFLTPEYIRSARGESNGGELG